MTNDTTTTPTGADSARPPRKTPAAPPQGPPVIVLARALRNGVTIAGARVAKGHTVRCTRAVAEFHEGRGEAVIVGTA